MRRIRFNSNYETITANKEYDIHKIHADSTTEYLYFFDDINEEWEIAQQCNMLKNDFYEVITCENEQRPLL